MASKRQRQVVLRFRKRHTPASTLVISSTLIPAKGSVDASPVAAAETKRRLASQLVLYIRGHVRSACLELRRMESVMLDVVDSG
jgi:hypothetical protein